MNTRAPLNTAISNTCEADAGARLATLADMEHDDADDLVAWETRGEGPGARASRCDVARTRRPAAFVVHPDPSLSGRFPGLPGVDFAGAGARSEEPIPQLTRPQAGR